MSVCVKISWTALHNAAEKGDKDVCLKLIQHGDSLDVCSLVSWKGLEQNISSIHTLLLEAWDHSPMLTQQSSCYFFLLELTWKYK